NEVFLAYGGKESLAKLDKGYVLLGSQTDAAAQEPSVTFRQVRKSANLRMDVERGSEAAPISTVYDGVAAWKATGKVVEDLSEGEVNVLKNARDHEISVLSHFGDPEYSFKLLGRTSYRASPVYAIEMTHSGESSTIFVDEKNYLIVGIAYKGVDANSKAF